MVGASGFVGAAVVRAFERAGWDVASVVAPRLSVRWGTDGAVAARAWELACSAEFEALVDALAGADSVVVAAGSATPTAAESEQLWGANAVLPAVVASAARRAGAVLVHVSSAAVQGSVAELDESPFASRSNAICDVEGGR